MGKTVLHSLDSGNKHKQEVEVMVQFKKKNCPRLRAEQMKNHQIQTFRKLIAM